MKEIKLTSTESRILNQMKVRSQKYFHNGLKKSSQGLFDKKLIKLTDFGGNNYEITELGKEF